MVKLDNVTGQSNENWNEKITKIQKRKKTSTII